MVARGLLQRVQQRLGLGLAAFLDHLPALLGGLLCLRLFELAHASMSMPVWNTFAGAAIFNDALSVLRYGWLLFLAVLPLTLLSRERTRTVLLGLAWTCVLCLSAALVQYQWVSGVMLGADLFAYSWQEVMTTVGGGFSVSVALVVAVIVSIAAVWLLLARMEREWWPRATPGLALIVLLASVLAFAFVPDHVRPDAVKSDEALAASLNKTAYFLDNNWAHLRNVSGAEHKAARNEGKHWAPWSGSDERYPFLHANRTPDTLGPLLNVQPQKPPHLVFIIVEGLGRSFSGPGARYGSFTPFLDSLAQRSLYWENFIAGQGRTFAVLPTVFGSLPFGPNGYTALAGEMETHASLMQVLKQQGYATRFYTGSNLEFDNEGAYLRKAGVETLVSEKDFGAAYQRSNEWGYGDRDLMEVALQHERQQQGKPSVSIIQTTSMHTPFTFPGKAAFMDKVPQRLDQLGVPAERRAPYTAQQEIFASILYADDALRHFFEQAATLPGYGNTIFIITGDHRLPELPMDTRIERYHVPLIVFSPMLKAPRAIKSISSQFDITPSLLAMMANQYGLKAPAQVPWLGTGLDTEPEFRNLHAIPMKQTKTEMSDFISGIAYLAQGQLYTITDGMQAERADSDTARIEIRSQFAAFQSANGTFGRSGRLAPAETLAQLQPYDGAEATLRSVRLAAEPGAVAVQGSRATVADGMIEVKAQMVNHGDFLSPPISPLLVLTDAAGNELAEATGAAHAMQANAKRDVSLRIDARKLPKGTYFVSLLPSNPDTGKPAGIGQYHMPVQR